MRIALIGPTDHSINGNPGWHMITDGIRHLVLRAVPEAVFVPVSMMSGSDEGWVAASDCHAAILCGNPRFTMSVGDAFWENAIWDELIRLEECGVRVIDGWAGSAFPSTAYTLSAEEMATAIMHFPYRKARLEQAARITGRITRDATMQTIYERSGATSTLLPCSSWWADQSYPQSGQAHTCDVLVTYRIAAAAQQRIVERRLSDRPLRVLALNYDDYMWARQQNLNPELVCDAPSLLRILKHAENMLSFRLHAAIPAASVGCKVIAVSIDSRTDTCKPFGIPVVRFDQLEELPEFVFASGLVDDKPVVKLLKEMLC